MLEDKDRMPFRTFQECIPARAIQNVPLPLRAQPKAYMHDSRYHHAGVGTSDADTHTHT